MCTGVTEDEREERGRIDKRCRKPGRVKTFTINTNTNATRQDVSYRLVNKTNGTVTDVGSYLAINKNKTSTSKTEASKCTIKCKKLPSSNRTFYLEIKANDGQGKVVYQKIIVNK